MRPKTTHEIPFKLFPNIQPVKILLGARPCYDTTWCVKKNLNKKLYWTTGG